MTKEDKLIIVSEMLARQCKRGEWDKINCPCCIHRGEKCVFFKDQEYPECGAITSDKWYDWLMSKRKYMC